jgi:putative methyltransferase (TIGR04325 family)
LARTVRRGGELAPPAAVKLRLHRAAGWPGLQAVEAEEPAPRSGIRRPVALCYPIRRQDRQAQSPPIDHRATHLLKGEMPPTAVDLIPPALLPSAKRLIRIARRMIGSPHLPAWQYVPEGWRKAQETGWSDHSIVETQKRKWPAFVAAVSGTGMLGVAHEMPEIVNDVVGHHNTIMTFAYVLAREAAGRRRMSVLDWGGGMGHYAVIARSVLPDVTFDYTVVDLPDLCRAGREVLPDVRFEAETAAWSGGTFDLTVASSALQYVEDWPSQLRTLAKVTAGRVYVTRIPIVEHAATHVVMQRPHHVGYTTEYIGWVFNRGEFIREAEAAGLVLEREVIIEPGLLAEGAPEEFRWGGFLFKASPNEDRHR